MKRWTDIKAEIRSISQAEKDQLDLTAKLISQIVRRRLEQGLTQAEVAERAGLSQTYIARIENMSVVPRIDTLLKIAQGLRLNVQLIPEEFFDEQAVAASH